MATIQGMTTITDTRYRAVVTTEPELVTACQRLRRQVFGSEFGVADDRDESDEICDHLAVLRNDEVVGTYRILPPGRSERLYSQGEFALGALAPLRGELAEIGRSCVHPGHRTGAVINLMWAALGRYARSAGYGLLAGCASVSLADGGTAAANTWELARTRHLAPRALRVEPHRPWIPGPSRCCRWTRSTRATRVTSSGTAREHVGYLFTLYTALRHPGAT